MSRAIAEFRFCLGHYSEERGGLRVSSEFGLWPGLYLEGGGCVFGLCSGLHLEGVAGPGRSLDFAPASTYSGAVPSCGV